jgi:hypothetical protein
MKFYCTRFLLLSATLALGLSFPVWAVAASRGLTQVPTFD